MPDTLFGAIRRILALSIIFAGVTGVSAPGRMAPTGGLSGTVRDQVGAPIPNALVTVAGSQRRNLTSREGRYTFDSLPAGTISIRVTHISYRPAEVSAISIRPGQMVVQDIQLELAPLTLDEITVSTSATPLVPRDEVTSRQRREGAYDGSLPGNRASGVAALQPGVVGTPQSTMSIRAGRTDARYVDGVPVSPGFRGSGFTGTQEASVSTGASSDQFGNAASGVITLDSRYDPEYSSGERYAWVQDNSFLASRENPLSTFSIDVDAASYSNMRRFLNQGQSPPPAAVRIEEMINYFDYTYDQPVGNQPFSLTTEIMDAPWNSQHRLLLVGLQGRSVSPRALPPSNLVFLIDVSGSMASPDKLPLVQSAFRLLVPQLRAQDRVAIVVYAGAAGLVLPSTSGAEGDSILNAIDRLSAGGSTAGGAGIQLAYRVARENFIPGGNNRVILATDGDFNVGMTSDNDLVQLIEDKRKDGTFLTVLGFGTGNLQDAKMEQLADKGNGQYAYVDNLNEARKIFVQEMRSTLFTIAKDVKIQVEFNPSQVSSYRLIGYENRVLAAEDFNNDIKDAGELGAGHAVTALYELVPPTSGVDELRYSLNPRPPADQHPHELLTIKLRYKEPDGETSRLLCHTLRTDVVHATGNIRFASAVAAFGMILRNSEHRGSATPEMVVHLAREAGGADEFGYREEFIRLVESFRQTRNTALNGYAR